jgi:hypothetical protein
MKIRNIATRKPTRCLAMLGAAATLSLVPFGARAQENAADPSFTVKAADPAKKADGTLSPAAKAAIEHGPLPFSDADVAAKVAANRASEAAEKSAAPRPLSAAELAPAGETAGPPTPVIVGGYSTNRVCLVSLATAAPLIPPARLGPRASFNSSTVSLASSTARLEHWSARAR